MSVPLTVVMRTAVKTAPRGTEPPVIHINSPEVSPKIPDAAHVLPVTLVMVILPAINDAAVELLRVNPVVNVPDETDDAPNLAPPPTYPVVV